MKKLIILLGLILLVSFSVLAIHQAYALTATGGTITTNGANTVHTFTSNGTFTVTSGSGNISVLVVAGGGGGGGGGGGAGGLIYKNANFSVSVGSYTVIVGKGGTGTFTDSGVTATNGQNSTFGILNAKGGGGGGDWSSGTSGHTETAGNNGGSGGGGGGTFTNTLGPNAGTGVNGQGNSGGVALNGQGAYISGGGGANFAGTNTAGSTGGDGGDGLQININGTLLYWAGGGGGGGGGVGGGGLAGKGGGGVGGTGGVACGGLGGDGGNGVATTGGGGGGACGQNGTPQHTGGTGGSGIVIVSYTTPTIPSMTSSGSITLSGTYVQTTPNYVETAPNTACLTQIQFFNYTKLMQTVPFSPSVCLIQDKSFNPTTITQSINLGSTRNSTFFVNATWDHPVIDLNVTPNIQKTTTSYNFFISRFNSTTQIGTGYQNGPPPIGTQPTCQTNPSLCASTLPPTSLTGQCQFGINPDGSCTNPLQPNPITDTLKKLLGGGAVTVQGITYTPTTDILYLGQIKDEIIGVSWQSPSNINILNMALANYTAIGFSPNPIPPYNITGSSSSKSSGQIKYTVTVPSNFCSNSVTVNCLDPNTSTFTVPVTMIVSLDGNTVQNTLNLTFTILKQQTIATYTIVGIIAIAGIGIGISNYINRKGKRKTGSRFLK